MFKEDFENWMKDELIMSTIQMTCHHGKNLRFRIFNIQGNGDNKQLLMINFLNI